MSCVLPDQLPPQPQPCAANARTSAPAGDGHARAHPRAVQVRHARRVRRAAARDVRVLDRVDVDRAPVGVVRPVARARRRTAVERRRVVGLDRAEVVAAVGVDREHAADREARVVEGAEGADDRGRRIAVDDQAPAVRPAVEADVGERDEPQVVERDRAAADASSSGVIVARIACGIARTDALKGGAASADAARPERRDDGRQSDEPAHHAEKSGAPSAVEVDLDAEPRHRSAPSRSRRASAAGGRRCARSSSRS